MKNRDIYALALALLSESGSAESTADYEERAGYLLSAYCSEVRELAEKLASVKGEAKVYDDPLFRPLDHDFPYDSALASPGAYYLAAMLILDEDPDLSDRLFSRYCDAVSRICAGLPMQSEEIRDRYGFD